MFSVNWQINHFSKFNQYENIRILHRNMFPIQTVINPIPKTNDKNFTLMKANLLMDLYFDD